MLVITEFRSAAWRCNAASDKFLKSNQTAIGSPASRAITKRARVKPRDRGLVAVLRSIAVLSLDIGSYGRIEPSLGCSSAETAIIKGECQQCRKRDMCR